MAQLSSDQFAFGDALLSVEAALARAVTGLEPVSEIDEVPLDTAAGRVLAHDLVAPIPLPPFFNSAVDGYAVRFADLASDGPTRLTIGARVAAGAQLDRAIRRGEALRIFTGAPMPDEADTVFMQEDVTRDEDSVVLPQGLKRFANCRPAGEDLAAGARALAAGTSLTPEAIALVAALGIERVMVRRRLKVAVFSTGDEIASPGTVRPPAAVYDSNRFMLRAMLLRLGADVTDLGILADDRAVVARALRSAARAHDAILTSGGVSTGEEDHVKAAVETVGMLSLWRIAIKPGRPVAMGVIDGAAFIGLPGNPVAVFVTFAHIVRPVLATLAGARVEKPIALPVRAAFGYRKKEGRREYVRVSLRSAADGGIEAHKHPREGAGIVTSLTETDGLVELPESVTRVESGDSVGFFAYAVLR